ncbi:MAG: hypothetical protein COA63_013900 [Methylophaga sp.]|nr:hypothetical protein [Methylophaga sp.]
MKKQTKAELQISYDTLTAEKLKIDGINSNIIRSLKKEIKDIKQELFDTSVINEKAINDALADSRINHNKSNNKNKAYITKLEERAEVISATVTTLHRDLDMLKRSNELNQADHITHIGSVFKEEANNLIKKYTIITFCFGVLCAVISRLL